MGLNYDEYDKLVEALEAEIAKLEKQCEGLADAAMKNGQGLILAEAERDAWKREALKCHEVIEGINEIAGAFITFDEYNNALTPQGADDGCPTCSGGRLGPLFMTENQRCTDPYHDDTPCPECKGTGIDPEYDDRTPIPDAEPCPRCGTKDDTLTREES